MLPSQDAIICRCKHVEVFVFQEKKKKIQFKQLLRSSLLIKATTMPDLLLYLLPAAEVNTFFLYEVPLRQPTEALRTAHANVNEIYCIKKTY